MTVHRSPPGLPHHYSDIEVQTRFTFELLTKQLEANAPTGHTAITRACSMSIRAATTVASSGYGARCLPDTAKAPALAFVPSTEIMFDGRRSRSIATCVVRATRSRIDETGGVRGPTIRGRGNGGRCEIRGANVVGMCTGRRTR